MPQFPNDCNRQPDPDSNTAWSWPVVAEEVDEVMSDFLDIDSCNKDENNQTQKMRYEYEDYIGFDENEGKLKFVTISVDSSVMNPWSRLGEDITRVEYDYFMSKAAEMDEVAKDTCGPVLMTDLNQVSTMY